ncbi:MAG: low molecular weight phosphotyrosine protein phosphatase [Planctomycetes bacterium]|nr:low molecular weight phosphotyrosine protein phosphatase [Planctomycetota bacterium]
MNFPVKVVFVCLGNICRSPTAEAVFQDMAHKRGVADKFEIDSAGVGNWHVGDRPDYRQAHAAEQRGYRLDSFARQIKKSDFDHYDLILSMDQSVHDSLIGMAKTETHRAKIKLFREFDPDSKGEKEVPDPYYGGPEGFGEVISIVERGCRNLLEQILVGEI